MRRSSDLISSWVPAWADSPARVVEAARAVVPFDTLAAGVLTGESTEPDQWLAMHGYSAAQVLQWCQGGLEQDKLFKAATKGGQATAGPGRGAESSPLARDAHALLHVTCDSNPGRVWWWLLLTRRESPFSVNEQQLASLMLRHWHLEFARPDEPGMGRLMVGHDGRLLLADVNTQVRLLQQPDLLTELLAALQPVVAQRYPRLEDDQRRDVALSVGGEPFWIEFRRRRVVDRPTAVQWHLEIRPLDADELPPLGLVKDERIAEAVAFLHEKYADSPSLAEVARTVHVSPFHFHRLFTRQVGVSPKHYLQRKQLQMAKWLLRKGGVPIGQIAHKTGFSSHGHFTSTFHRLVGMSPSDYRDQH